MSSALKRVHSGEDGSPGSKRVRTNDQSITGSSASPAPVAAASNVNAADELARKKAEVAAKFAAMRKKAQDGPIASGSGGGASAAAAKQAKEDMQRRIAETANKLAKGGNVSHPFLVRQEVHPLDSRTQALLSQGNGRDEGKSGGIHPLLRQSEGGTNEPYKQSNKEKYAPLMPKFATSKANQRFAPASTSSNKPVASAPKPKIAELPRSSLPTLEEARQNPYFDRRLGVESLAPKAHKARPLRFNARGKFEKIAEEKRREAHMEEVKRRVLETARKAGMETEVDVASSAKVRRPAPPDIEWWDAAYLPSGSYDDIDNGVAQAIIYDYAKEADKAAITSFVQHPIPIPAPQDKKVVKSRPLDLTEKERKKKRKAERAVKLKDRQDRQRMGLLPPEPPKVKLANMMRVLTKEAVMDPTKVEAQVRTEMFARKNAHEKSNEERKLTHEDKIVKLEQKKQADEALGIHAAVFRVLNLSNGQHKFKIRKNAEQLNLTGCTLFHPRFALIIVEGGQKGVKAFTKLMMRRIDWTAEAPPRGGAGSAGAEDEEDEKKDVAEEMKPAVPMSENRCDLVWSGEHRSRIFEGMRPKSVPTDHMAREWLGPRAEGYFQLARRSETVTVAM